jgi:hypothetical protein
MGTKAYSASLESSAAGLVVMDWSVVSRTVRAAISSFLDSGFCASDAVTFRTWTHGCFS